MNLFSWILLIWVMSGLIGGIMYIPIFKKRHKNSNISVSFWIASVIFGLLVLGRVILDKVLTNKLNKLKRNDNNLV